MTTSPTGTALRRGDRTTGQPDGGGAVNSGTLAVRLLAMATAAAGVGLALLHPMFRHAEGHLSGAVVLPFATAAGVLVAGMAAGTAWSRAARWVAVALIGHAAALQLMKAGMMVGHQHYAPLGLLAAEGRLLAAGIVAAQFVAVGTAAVGQWRSWWRGAHALLGSAGISAVLAVFVLTSATLSQQVGTYVAELVLASAIQALNLATIALVVSAVPASALDEVWRRTRGILGETDAGGRERVVVSVLAIWVLVVGAGLAWFSYQAHPHVPDEVVYLYHARYLAQGLLSMPLPPVPAAFELDLMTYEATRWYSPVPPGWPAALAIGVVLGAAWLVNPVLNALNVVLAYALLRELYDVRTARVGAVLLCVSPWFLFMGMNFMTHTFTLTCALGAAVAVARLRRGASALWVVPGGAAIGVLGMIRPLEGLTVAVLLGLWGLGGFPWRAALLARVTLLALVAIATGALTLPYNTYLAGDALTFPLMAYTDSVYGAGTNALGFGTNRGLGWPGLDPLPGHGLFDVLINGNLNTHSVNVELFGWSIGSLLPIAALVATRRLERADVWMLVVIAAIVGIHSLYWFSGGPDFGARYWYLILVPCVALTARAVLTLGEGFRGPLGDAGVAAAQVRTRLMIGTAALAASAMICFVPWRAIDKYYHYRNMRPDVRQLAAEHGFGRSVVLVRGRRHPDYASAATYNPVDLQAGAPIYIWHRDTELTRQVLQAYADRPVWVLDGPTRTGAGFRVVAGPLRAVDLARDELAP